MRSRRKEAKAELDQAVNELYDFALLYAPEGKRKEVIRMRNDIEWGIGMLTIGTMADCEEVQFSAKGGAR